MGAQCTLWFLCLCLKLCWSHIAGGLRWGKHVAVIGQGVCASHCRLPDAQQVALRWFRRTELLRLWLREQRVKVCLGREGWEQLWTWALSHSNTFHSWYLSKTQYGQRGSSRQHRKQTDRIFACRSWLAQSCHRSRKRDPAMFKFLSAFFLLLKNVSLLRDCVSAWAVPHSLTHYRTNSHSSQNYWRSSTPYTPATKTIQLR